MTTIVVIEDNPQNARMADKLLKRAGYTVELAEDGEMGLTTVFENSPDLILIDLGLPDIDGQTVIGLIRQHDELAHVPVIAFTAWPPEEAHDMAKRYGCDGVITKPINTRTFADQIADFIEAVKSKTQATNTAAADTSIHEDSASDSATEDSATDEDVSASANETTIQQETDNNTQQPAASNVEKPETQTD